VFNNALSGYQEIVTDPSYAGQVITFTTRTSALRRHADDDESPARSAPVSSCATSPPTTATGAPSELRRPLVRPPRPRITASDTRRLTRHLRDAGALPGAFGTTKPRSRRRRPATSTDGIDLVARFTTDQPYVVGSDDAPFRVVAYDFGSNGPSLRHLVGVGVGCEVVPGPRPRRRPRREPDGVFLSTVRVIPRRSSAPIEQVGGLLGEVPVFGICLGHQILGLALGGSTYKLRFGHHGGNHPVRHAATGRVEITSQNHNYAVADGLAGVELTHVNLNDGVVEGFRVLDAPAVRSQHHPEAGTGSP